MDLLVEERLVYCPTYLNFTSHFTSLLFKVLASRISSHMKLRHPDSPGWAPWGSAVSLRCKFCAFVTFSAAQWSTHLNECSHLQRVLLKEKKTGEDRDVFIGGRSSRSGQNERRSEERCRRSRSPRRTWSPRRDICPQRDLKKSRDRSRSGGRAGGGWRSNAARRSSSPGDVCKICGEEFEGNLAVHLAAFHQDLSFR